MFFIFVILHADVWLSQAQNVPEFGRMLHLPCKVVQLSFHRQQEVREGLQELLRVRDKQLFFFFFLNHFLAVEEFSESVTNCLAG